MVNIEWGKLKRIITDPERKGDHIERRGKVTTLDEESGRRVIGESKTIKKSNTGGEGDMMGKYRREVKENKAIDIRDGYKPVERSKG